MSENELRSEIRSIRESLARIETKAEALETHMHAINVGFVDRVVRLETQMKIALGLIGAGSIGAASFLGIGG